MQKYSNKGAYLKFFTYAVVVILINVVGVTLFFRSDLTANRIYSLSQASKDAVKTLSEPLTIKVFFTKNLPAPHNSTERYLHDLFEAYAAAGGDRFNYTFYDVTADESGLTDQSNSNKKLAQDYGISPVQIRIIENDEMKFQQAYMGLVIIHGDMMEKIPAITSTDGVEYLLTTAIQKLNNKVSAFMALKEKVKIRFYLSSSLEKVAPLMGLDQLPLLPRAVEELAKKMNLESLDNIDYAFVDPREDKTLNDLAAKYDLMVMKWPDVPQQGIKAGSGGAGIVMEYRDRVRVTPVITSVNLPIIGTTYQMADPAGLETILSDTMETMIGINENLGYLADHGTPTLSPGGMMPGQPRSNMNAFNQLLSKRYSIVPVSLKEKNIPEGLKTLIIAKPTENFSDYELFQIDQALMRGTNIAFFLDAFKEIMPRQSMGMGGAPQYVPLNTGLEKLLKHYGITIEPAYVLDESCYKQQRPSAQGGGEQNIYFAPIIKDGSINRSLAFMNNIKGLITMQISPIMVDQDKLKQNALVATRLFSSSEKSWTMADRIDLNPMFMSPPTQTSEMKARDLAYMVSGEFSSYFAGKPLPAKPAEEKELSPEKESPSAATETAPNENNTTAPGAEKDALVAKIETRNAVITKGKPGKIFVMGCASMLQDNMLDPQGQSTNAAFILNVIDHLNDQDNIAVLRSKNQTFNPLAETTPMIRGIIKLFNIAGLPILIVISGFVVLLKRRGRKRKIKLMFQEN
ncbi:ABC-type uncharacterized transport system involved in gliding motility, auxiliary component [Desulfocicer vacuolatum DSM 3385]|uniref:ABC-type uncharacterized transport system involved in gliding motility, auxiliary component n=1 Tax=Desulfocicer vacuolatum DSM 3385 TaxID=1121400 RepID=A0A1W1YH50_9BACT|nr:Gldg family protein [Desulfocicer vacuolatum]SMC35464.1 ABC-type uncharacterized transport system involved in gliding motility, auxiliary component [Desulfocicer vacuolatum DSM 3385]